jgi:hypothetical protein
MVSEVDYYCFVIAMIECCIAIYMPSAVEVCLSSGCYHAGDRDRMLLGYVAHREVLSMHLYAY